MIPTDRVSIEEIPEEKQPVEALVQEAFQQRPELEQAVLTLRNDEITLKGARNALLPQVDIFGYLSGQGVAGTLNPKLNCSFYGTAASALRQYRRLWDGARPRLQQLVSGQGLRLQPHHSPRQQATRSRCRRGR